MKRVFSSVLLIVGIIIGVLLLIFKFTFVERPIWFEVAEFLFIIWSTLSGIKWYLSDKNKKIDNVNDDEIKQLLQEGKKKEAIERVKENSKCSLLNAIFYVGDLENH